MMTWNTIPQKCNYALRAIFELALRDSLEPVKVQVIASAQGIPPRFLEVILAELKHGGFVESRRGNEGGYLLARRPVDITVGEVIGFFQGRGNGRKRVDRGKGQVAGDCAFAEMWEKVNTSVANIYNNTTFADLTEQERTLMEKYVPNYAI